MPITPSLPSRCRIRPSKASKPASVTTNDGTPMRATNDPCSAPSSAPVTSASTRAPPRPRRRPGGPRPAPPAARRCSHVLLARARDPGDLGGHARSDGADDLLLRGLHALVDAHVTTEPQHRDAVADLEDVVEVVR